MASNMNLWLNTLTRLEAMSLLDMMRSAVGTTDTVTITGGLGPLGLNCLGSNSPRTGSWYQEWACCEIISLALPGTGHPRWQPRVVAGGATPANPTSLGRAIKSKLRAQTWDDLKNIANSNGQVKIPCHHLAFLAGNTGISIPANMGTGASMSHLCDSSGCIRESHLELTVQHVDNLERQRCHGVTLIASLDLIIHELPCSHGRGNSTEELIATSCRKLRMVWLPNASVSALIENYQQIYNALASSESSQQSQ
jgi:hypothetical protein